MKKLLCFLTLLVAVMATNSFAKCHFANVQTAETALTTSINHDLKTNHQAPDNQIVYNTCRVKPEQFCDEYSGCYGDITIKCSPTNAVYNAAFSQTLYTTESHTCSRTQKILKNLISDAQANQCTIEINGKKTKVTCPNVNSK